MTLDTTSDDVGDPDGSALSDVLLEHVIREAPVPIVMTRMVNRELVVVNAAACEFLGRTEEELVGTRIDAYLTAETRDELDRSRVDGVTRFVTDCTYVRGDGTLVLGRVHALRLPAVDWVAASVIVDMSSAERARERLDLLTSMSSLIASGDDPTAQLDAVGELVEREAMRRFGWTVTIEWTDDQSPPPTAPGAVAVPIQLGRRREGWLIVADAGGSIGDDDHAYATALARLLGAAKALYGVRTELQSAALFESGFESTAVGMKVVAPDGTYQRVNQAFATMLGYPVEALVGRNWREFLHPDDQGSELFGGIVDGEPGAHSAAVRRYVRADGSVLHAQISAAKVAVGGADGNDHLYLSHVVDVTPQFAALEAERAARTELVERERRFRSLVEPTIEMVVRIDGSLRIRDANPSAVAAFGTTAEDIVGVPLVGLLPEKYATIGDRIVEAMATGEPSEIWRVWLTPADRPPGWYVVRLLPEEANEQGYIDHVCLVASDITLLVENEQRLAVLTETDSLTGAASRLAIFERLQHVLDRLDRHDAAGVAVAVIDLDRFKGVNDTFGHQAGDAVIRGAADAIRDVIRGDDTLGRLGGDEFVVVFQDVVDGAAAEALGARVSDALRDTEVQVGPRQRIGLSASVGVAWTDTVVAADEMLGRADEAMYEVKRGGRGRSVLHTLGTGAGRSGDHALLADLTAAIETDQFELHYQPIADTLTGAVTAAEALLRWRHPEHGLLTPDRFLAMLLQSGRIGSVGRWVIRTAVQRLAEWSTDPLTADLRVHVNVSPAELADPGLVDYARSELRRSAVVAERLVVEITEQALAGSAVPSSAFDDLSELGIPLVLDDFGTGASSLTHLRTAGLQGIKIDRSFVAGAMSDPRERAIVEGVVGLAIGLGIDVVAEGVETDEQMGWLTQAGTTAIQGWHLGRAMPPDDLVAWLGARVAVSTGRTGVVPAVGDAAR